MVSYNHRVDRSGIMVGYCFFQIGWYSIFLFEPGILFWTKTSGILCFLRHPGVKSTKWHIQSLITLIRVFEARYYPYTLQKG